MAERCVQVDVPVDQVEHASDQLWAEGASAIQELDLGHGRVRLVAGVPAEAEVAIRRRLDGWHPDFFDAEFDGWLDAWRPFARPVRSGRVVVHPPWEPPPWPDLPTSDDDVVIAIDSGRSFGQGNHATTRLVLARLPDLVGPDAAESDAAESGVTVLDVGCGSGVLTVAAAALGARRVVGVDIEPDALARTTANAERNGVDGRVEVTDRTLDEIVGGDGLDARFDVVLANILAPVLRTLAPAITAHLAPGGALVLSGLRTDQRAEVLAAYRGLELIDEAADDSWVALVLTAAPAPTR